VSTEIVGNRRQDSQAINRRQDSQAMFGRTASIYTPS